MDSTINPNILDVPVKSTSGVRLDSAPIKMPDAISTTNSEGKSNFCMRYLFSVKNEIPTCDAKAGVNP